MTLCLICASTEDEHEGPDKTCPPDFEVRYGTWAPTGAAAEAWMEANR